jgi:LacI family transcriptional regulator
MKDVAKLAGVSTSTVSRVISKTMFVDDKTKARVEAAIKKVNYRPNLVARGLRSKSGNLIGLLVPEVIHTTFAFFIKYIEESVARYGFNLILCNTHNDPETEELFIDSLLRRNVDGIIFSRVSDKSRVLRILENTNVPIVVIDRALGSEDVHIPAVLLDNFKAGCLAAEYLVSCGHTEIACITGPLDIRLSRDRLDGFRATLEKHSIDLKNELVCEGDFKFDSGKKAADYLMAAKKRFSAVWAQSDLMAIGVMREFSRLGFSLPDDLSVIGMDNTNLVEMVTPTLTTIAQPFQEMCDTAVDLIMRKISDGEDILYKRIVLDPVLMVRESVRAL